MSGLATTGLLLDVDDTLVDTRTAMVAAGQAAVTQLWPHLAADITRAAGIQFHSDPRGLFGRFTSGQMSFADMRQARVADLLESFRLTGVDEVSERFEEAYAPAFIANLRVFDDVWPLLEAARVDGVPLGLLTNSSSSYTELKLELTGLAGAFAVVATRDTLGFGKPDARAFHHACGLLGTLPARCMYVGDHLEIDAIASKDAGLSGVWLDREPGGSHGAAQARARGIPVVTSLRQVPTLWQQRAERLGARHRTNRPLA